MIPSNISNTSEGKRFKEKKMKTLRKREECLVNDTITKVFKSLEDQLQQCLTSKDLSRAKKLVLDLHPEEDRKQLDEEMEMATMTTA
jgi:hypothetical protein